MHTQPHTRRGFTLIEILVVIAIIAILIALALPALASARTMARQTQAISNIRQVGSSFEMYSGTYKTYPFIRKGFSAVQGDMPMPTPPGLFTIPWWPKGSVVATNSEWRLSFMWPGLMAAIAPWEENYKIWVSPGRTAILPEPESGDMRIDPESMVSILYSNSFIGAPKLWSTEGQGGTEEAMIRAVQPADVVLPSSKAMLYDADIAYIRKTPPQRDGHYDHPTPIQFADGHADVKNPLEAAETFANPLNALDRTALHNTKDGVRGRDY